MTTTDGVSEGARVPCVYINCTGTVTIDTVEEVAGREDGDGSFEGYAVAHCEGECDTCHRRVDWDYDPLARRA